jgi:tropomyosin
MTSTYKYRITALRIAQANIPRLRQTDVKAGHFERKVQALEQERDQWEAKYEEVSKKYATIQKELEDFQAEIGAM